MLYVLPNTRLELAAMVLNDNMIRTRDRLSWGESAGRQFMVKSAYNMLIKKTNLNDRTYW